MRGPTRLTLLFTLALWTLASAGMAQDGMVEPPAGTGPAMGVNGFGGQSGGSPVVAPLVVPSADSIKHLPIMTIDQERLFVESRWGRRAQMMIEEQGRALAAENERLADEFLREEQELTELRETLAPEEFRRRADEFDQRVIDVRRERDAAAREFQQLADQERVLFFQAALPILAQIMQEREAVVVLDQRMIFVSAESIDVTDDLIERVDAVRGDGADDVASEAETTSPTNPSSVEE